MKLFNKVIGIATVVIFAAGAVDCNAMKAKTPTLFSDDKKAEDLAKNFAKKLASQEALLKTREGAMDCFHAITDATEQFAKDLTSAHVQTMLDVIEKIDDKDADVDEDKGESLKHVTRFKKWATNSLQQLKDGIEETELVLEGADKDSKALVLLAGQLTSYSAPGSEDLTAIKDEIAAQAREVATMERVVASALASRSKMDKALIVATVTKVKGMKQLIQQKLEETDETLDAFLAGQEEE